MSNPQLAPRGTQPRPATSGKALRWRTVDIVIAAVLAVAGGVIFAVYDHSYTLMDPLWAAFPPSAGLQTGVWLFAGILAGLIIRRPGAALLVELIAAAISAMIGSSFGLAVLASGIMQGIGAELGLIVWFLYRSYGLPSAALAGALAGFGCGINDTYLLRYYPEWPAGWLWAYIAFVALSGLITGVVMFFLTRGLAATGALGPLRSRGAHRESLLG